MRTLDIALFAFEVFLPTLDEQASLQVASFCAFVFTPITTGSTMNEEIHLEVANIITLEITLITTERFFYHCG